MVFLQKLKPLVLFLLVFLLCSCKTQYGSQLTAEADSLVLLTLELQQRISSSEIQRLSEFRDEIILDLDSLGIRDDISTDAEEIILPPGELIMQYVELNRDLVYCLQACSQFHEEAFMLETTIQEIKVQSGVKGADQDVLMELLEEEWLRYDDLACRIDSSIENVNHHSRLFYSLKPAIDSILSPD